VNQEPVNDNPQYAIERPGSLFYLGWVVTVLCVVGAMGGLVLARELWMRRQTSALQSELREGPQVLVMPVSRAPGVRTLSLPGEIHGYIETAVYAKVAGYLKSIKVDKGDRVKAGDLIAVLESPELDRQVENARADYEIKKLTDERFQVLLKTSVIARQDADQSHAAMMQAKAALEQLRAMQSYEVIRAPFSGIITARNVDPGVLIPQSTAAGANAATPIVSMATLSPVRIYVQLPQSSAPFVKNGDAATVTVTEYPGREFKGAVTRHPAALASATRTMLAEIDLPNDDSALYPGMYAHVAIRIEGRAGVPQVPDDALIFRKDKVYVPIVEADHLRLIEVSLGYDNGQTVEITRGLSGGEMVALNVGQTAHDGAPVRPHRLDQNQH